MASDDAPRRGRPVVDYREFGRDGVSITAWVREHGGGRQRVEVTNLSRAGFRIKTASLISADRMIFITLPGFAPLKARIAWHDGQFYGCEFDQRLHEAIYDHILHSYPTLRDPS